jgi:transcriptional regulator of acetoin/glycerol metabolism
MRVMPDSATLSISPERGSARPELALPSLTVLITAGSLELPSSTHALAETREVRIGRGAANAWRREGATVILELADRRTSSEHARLSPDGKQWVLEDLGSKNGCYVNASRVTRALLRDGDLIELGHTFLLFRLTLVSQIPSPLDVATPMLDSAPALRTFHAPLREQLADLRRVAGSTLPVVITGATGTGKERVGRAIHELSGRSGQLVAVNCGALPSNLVESELFGSKRGAFSGAVEDRPGLVRAADGGTLMLDEIGELDPAAQTALLRVIQESEVLPIGGTRPIKVDVRVLAATHRNLQAEVLAGRFREDLWARLAGYRIALPRLDDRREDLGLLIMSMVKEIGGARELTHAAARHLLQRKYPRNVRELELSLRAALALAGDGPIDLQHLKPIDDEPPAEPAADALPDRPEDVERRERLEALLVEHGGNVSAVARELGKDRAQVHRWLKRYALDPLKFRG